MLHVDDLVEDDVLRRAGAVARGRLVGVGHEPEAARAPVAPHDDTARHAPEPLEVRPELAVAAGVREAADQELAVAGVGGGEPFWQAVRDNLGTVAEAADWWSVCTVPVTPVIEAESQAVTNAAAELLPDGDLPAEIWRDWTNAIATATGVKGRGLFMPLRLALTGRQKGPEIAPLLSFMGRARVIERLRGNTA